jgi:hypothetical protein
MTTVEATVRALCPARTEVGGKGPTILNVGFGLGIVSMNLIRTAPIFIIY